MSRKKKKVQIKQLQKDLKTAYRATDYRLLRLTLVMLILVIVAAYIYGRIQL